MRLSVAVAFAVSLALLTTACDVSEGNPFSDAFRLRPPPGECAILFSSNLYAAKASAPPELYCVDIAGGTPQRLTYANTSGPSGAMLEAAPASDSKRVVTRRVTTDTNGDHVLGEGDSTALTFLDLARGAIVDLVPPSSALFGVDWSPVEDVVIYSAPGAGGRADLYAIDINSESRAPFAFTATADADERRPRFDRTASVIAYERADSTGRATVWIIGTATQQQITQGAQQDGAAVVATDSDPAVSPDGQAIVFRRLSDCALAPPGGWEILTLTAGDTWIYTTIAPGCAYRGAPDWGQQGIVFTEVDPQANTTALILTDVTGGNRRVLLSVPPSFILAYPRWLPAAR